MQVTARCCGFTRWPMANSLGTLQGTQKLSAVAQGKANTTFEAVCIPGEGQGMIPLSL